MAQMPQSTTHIQIPLGTRSLQQSRLSKQTPPSITPSAGAPFSGGRQSFTSMIEPIIEQQCICTYIRWHSSTKNVWPFFVLLDFFSKTIFRRHVKYYSLARVCWSDPFWVPWDPSVYTESRVTGWRIDHRYKFIAPLDLWRLRIGVSQ